MIGKYRALLALSAISSIGAGYALAQGSSPAVVIKSELEKLVPAGEGQPPVKTYVEPGTVVPGDRIRYTLTFHNHGSEPVSGVNLVDPIPEGIIFEETADTKDFSVSTDGGKSFGPLDAATVAVSGAAPRPATPADVTHVRWHLSDAVAPGQGRTVAFLGRVK